MGVTETENRFQILQISDQEESQNVAPIEGDHNENIREEDKGSLSVQEPKKFQHKVLCSTNYI